MKCVACGNKTVDYSIIEDFVFSIEEKYKVKFLYRDFRPYFYEGKKMFKETGLYMQKYCGCVFSEEERYLKK